MLEAIEALPAMGDPEGVAMLLAAADLLMARLNDAVDELAGPPRSARHPNTATKAASS